MRIAEQVVKDGMKSGSAFADALEQIVADDMLTRIIETGTYHGMGTTSAVIRGLMKHGMKPMFISIEVNPEHCSIAKSNLIGQPVEIWNGLSISRDLLPSSDEITFDDYEVDTIVDHYPRYRRQKYFDETAYDVEDNLLMKSMVFVRHYPDMIILDSAGHIGTIEFDYLMKQCQPQGTFYLALDDTNHVKHAKTVAKVENEYNSELVFDTDEKFGSRIYRISIHGNRKSGA